MTELESHETLRSGSARRAAVQVKLARSYESASAKRMAIRLRIKLMAL